MIFFYLPLFVLILSSFNEGKGQVWTGFSMKWYRELFFHSDRLWQAFRYSIIIALTSATLSTMIGTLELLRFIGIILNTKEYLQIISYLPLVLPDIIMGYLYWYYLVHLILNLGL